MFLTRVPGFGNTTNLNRKRSRRPSTSPGAGRRSRPNLEALETRQLLSTYVVNNTNDYSAGSPPITGSLRWAITSANLDHSPDDIVFNIPAAEYTPDGLQVGPVPGFNPVTQDWTITLQSPLPAITNTVSIDGYTEAPVGVPYQYPAQHTSAVQDVLLIGLPTGGTFTLSTSAPLPVGTTGPIPFNATPDQVQGALYAIPGMAGNVAVTGQAGTYFVAFQGHSPRRRSPT